MPCDGPPNECWPWAGFTNPKNGYGQFTRRWSGNQTNFYAHRVAWERVNGPIAEAMTVDHLCGNRVCCNPGHMELVPLAENSRRGSARRWVTVGDEATCRHGHVGERRQDRAGKWYCRACNRERLRAARAK